MRNEVPSSYAALIERLEAADERKGGSRHHLMFGWADALDAVTPCKVGPGCRTIIPTFSLLEAFDSHFGGLTDEQSGELIDVIRDMGFDEGTDGYCARHAGAF